MLGVAGEVMKNILFIIGLLAVSLRASSQEGTCGTTVTPEQLSYMDDFVNTQTSFDDRSLLDVDLVQVPLHFWLIRRSDGSGGLDESRISSLISEANVLYANTGIEFYQPSAFEFVDSDDFFNLDSSEEQALALTRDKNGLINVYISGTLTSGDTPLCGYTRFPPSPDRVFVAQGCADDVSTFAHELGHYFTLFHTHGKTNTGTTDEFVNGTNCMTAGDDICDTPADPNLTGLVNNACDYIGSLTDANGELFTPNPRNIMAYSIDACQTLFTAGQYSRIRTGLEEGRSYLNLKYENFTARFTSESRSGCAPTTIEFDDITNNSFSREWTFEGGSVPTSTRKTVSVTYDTPGTYDVSLLVRNADGDENEIVRSNYIIIRDPQANTIQDASFESFESYQIPDKWNLENPDKLLSWESSSLSSDLIGGSLMLRNFDYTPEVIPQIDNLNLSSFDLIDIRSFNLSMSYAYAPKFSNQANASINHDTLALGYTLDCSDDVVLFFKRGGDELRTTSQGLNTFFIPEDEEWKNLTVTLDKESVPAFDTYQSITPIIQNQCGNGNNLYIDRIRLTPDFSLDSLQFFRGSLNSNGDEISVQLRWANFSSNSRSVIIEFSIDGVNFNSLDTISSVLTNYTHDIDESVIDENNVLYYRVYNFNNKTTSSYSKIVEISTTITDVSRNPTLSIYPNPSSQYFHISSNENTVLLELQILNVAGQILYQQPLNRKNNYHSIDVAFLNSGTYICKIMTDEKTVFKKIIKE